MRKITRMAGSRAATNKPGGTSRERDMVQPGSRDSEPVADLVLLPLGEVDGGIFERIRSELAAVLGNDVRSAAGKALTSDALNKQRGQYNSTRILEFLDADHSTIGRPRILAIVDVDLYTDGLNFVFGEAAPSAGLAVVSLWRLRPEDPAEAADAQLFERRAVREAIHETGHLLGLGHCRSRGCVMNFSNSLPEVDAKSSEFCAACCGRLERA